eukprot:Skav236653  [mRNA]  locus=scaffold691:264633:270341:- [translate_table: standard]
MTVGKQAEGQWKAVQHPRGAHLLRALIRLLECRFGVVIRHEHVFAHSGDPGNEAADVLAGAAAQGYPLHDWTHFFQFSLRHDFVLAAEWCWQLFHCPLDAWWDGTMLCLPQRPLGSGNSLPLHFEKPTEPPTLTEGQVHLKIASCNVLTLKSSSGPAEEHHGLCGPARQELIFKQCAELRFHIVAFQETRLRRAHCLYDNRFVLVHCPATSHGHGGVLAGFNKEIPYAFAADGSPLYFTNDVFSVLVCEPRLLILRLVAPLLKCILIVGHAPHCGQPEAANQQFWDDVRAALPLRYSTWPRILCVDANVEVGHEPTDHVGSWQSGPSEARAEHFVRFLEGERLFLPATFAHLHEGPRSTWQHSSGSWRRIDYIAVSMELPLTSCSSSVCDELDVSLERIDHKAVQVELSWTARDATGSATRHHQPRLHFEDLDVDRLRRAAQIQVSMTANIHEHSQQMDTLLRKCFRRSRQKTARPMKESISQETWDLVQQKRRCRGALADAERLRKRAHMACFFHAWRAATPPQLSLEEARAGVEAWDQLIHQQDHIVADLLALFRQLGRQVTAALRADDRAFFSALASDFAEFPSPSAGKAFWQRVQRALPKLKSKRLLISPHAIEKFEGDWDPHFCQLEAGNVTDAPRISQDCQRRQACMPYNQMLDLRDLPSLIEVEDSFRLAQPGKATGLDPVPSGVAHYFPIEVANLYYELFLKAFAWNVEPLNMKGGILTPIPKRQDFGRVSHFRGILLLPTVSKRFHALLRKRVIQAVHDVRCPGQLGGFAGQEVPFASQGLRAFLNVLQHRGHSTGTLFVDLTSAFHFLVREFLTGITDNNGVLQVLKTLMAAGQDVQTVHACLQSQVPILQKLGMKPHLIALLGDIHHDTWYKLRAGPVATCTHRGTRPGSPLADAMFHLIMHDVMMDIDRWVRQQQRYMDLLATVETDPVYVAWSDDLAVPWAASSAQLLLEDMKQLVVVVDAAFSRRGFQLNCSRGKTSIVVSLVGTGAAEVRRGLRHEDFGQLECGTTSSGAPQRLIAVVPHYKHLGTFLTEGLNMDVEVAARIGSARHGFNMVAKQLICNPRFPLTTRRQMYRLLITSKLFFGAGAWPLLSKKLMQKLQAFELRCLQRLLRLRPDDAQTMTVEDTYALAQQPLPRVRLAVERLLYAGRLFRNGPAFVHLLVHLEGPLDEWAWIHGLAADLQWLDDLCPGTLPNGWQADWTTLIDQWQNPSFAWKGLVLRGLRRHLAQEACNAEAVMLHRKIVRQLESFGVTFTCPPLADRHHRVGDLPYKCGCGKAFSSGQGLATHQRLVHSVYSAEHDLLSGTVCPWCLKEFWCTQRLQQHLSYISRRSGVNECFQRLRAIGYSTEYEAAKRAPQWRGTQRMDALQLPGPRLQDTHWATLELHHLEMNIGEINSELANIAVGTPEQEADLCVLLRDATWAWRDAFIEAGHCLHGVPDLADLWLEALLSLSEELHPWGEDVFAVWCREGLVRISDELIDGELEALIDQEVAAFLPHLPRQLLRQRLSGLHRLGAHLVAARQTPVAHRQIKWAPANERERTKWSAHVPNDYFEQKQWLDTFRCATMQDFPADPGVPVVSWRGEHYVIVAHLFSGRRRQGDLHSWLHNWAETSSVKVLVLSLDTAICETYGNLAHWSVSWKQLLRCYDAGLIGFTMSGPPCETFTEARHTPLPPHPDGTPRRGPRPLRSAEMLIGLPGLTFRELRQVQQGTAFMLQVNHIHALHLGHGGYFVQEHPAPPELDERASIWTAPSTQLLRGHPETKLHVVPQWAFGAASVKPTGLLAFRLPQFLPVLWKHRDPAAVGPTTTSIGLDSRGAFRAAALKEYPAFFSQAVAATLWQQFLFDHRAGRHRVVQDPPGDLMEWIFSAAERGQQWQSHSAMRPDYQEHLI